MPGIKINLTTCLLFFYSLIANAQGPPSKQGSPTPGIGLVKGQILDKLSSKPVEYATVALIAIPDSSKITGALADEKGNFSIEDIAIGKYILKASFIGYTAYRSDTIFISFQKPVVNLKTIRLSESSAAKLDEVVVQGERDVFQSHIDKKVFNVEKNALVIGGSATDVLRQIPTLNVDVDGNIQMRGSGNITVWINGRPSGITGSSRQAVLDQIPAGSIESIEMITNPSAKYDPDGTSGIINIVLKKNRQDGFNGNISAGIGTRNKYNANGSFNFRKGKWNISNTIGGRYNQNWNRNSNFRDNLSAIDKAYLGSVNQRSGEESYQNSLTYNNTTDYNINDRNVIGLSLLAGTNQNAQIEGVRYTFLDAYKNIISTRSRDIPSNSRGFNLDGSLYYRKTYTKPQKELYIAGSASFSENNGQNSYDQRDFFPDGTAIAPWSSLSNINSKGQNQIYVFQTDYTNPVNEKTKIELGLKSTARFVGNGLLADSLNRNVDAYVNNANISNEYLYSESVNAAYGIITKTLGNYGLQAGLRAEQTFVEGRQVTLSQTDSYNYFSLFPNANILRKLPGENELKLSYSRRINRPGSNQLNPFPNYTDPINLNRGNPMLRPEYIESLELSHSKNWKDHSLTSTLYFRQTNNAIQRVRTIDPLGVSVTEFQNVSYGRNFGLELVGRIQFYDWWNITPSINLFGNEVTGTIQGAEYSNANINGNGRMMMNFKFWKGASLQLSGNYMLPNTGLQGTFQGFNGVDIGFRKDILKNKLSLSANLSDVFDTRQFHILMNGSNFSGEMIRKRESRILTVNLTYKFGQELAGGKSKKARREDQVAPSGGGMDY